MCVETLLKFETELVIPAVDFVATVFVVITIAFVFVEKLIVATVEK